MKNHTCRAAGALILLVLTVIQSLGQKFSDANWISMNPSIPGTDGYVGTAVVDGSGNLYIGGTFAVEGDTPVTNIAKWNGSSWSALGSGITGTVSALAVSGSDLYVGGNFTAEGGIAATNRADEPGIRHSHFPA